MNFMCDKTREKKIIYLLERTLWWIGALTEFYYSGINEWYETCILMKYDNNCMVKILEKETVQWRYFNYIHHDLD